MKCNFRSLLLPLLAPALLLNVPPGLSAPAQVVAQLASGSQSGSSQVYAIANPAVVTIYAGRQIGSGSIVSSDGLVITNQHVVRRVGNGTVEVRTARGRTYNARVIATDRPNDLALLQLNTSEQLPTIRFSDASGIRVGESVYAIGSPFGRAGVMTTGTLRAIRSNGDLQSKVLLKPGNSGGPLLNSQGALIGVNKGILESNRGENTGISFATSMTVARNFIERYRPGTVSTTIAQRSVQPPVAIAPPPTSGIPSITGSQPLEFPAGIAEVQPVSPVPDIAGSQPLEFPAGIAEVQPAPADIIVQPIPVPTAPDFAQSFPETELVPPTVRPKPSGARLGVIMDTRNLTVQRVQPGSPAAVAGLRQGDRLLAINGNPLRSFNQLQAFLNQLPDGAVLTIRRNARPTNVSIRF